MYLSLFLAPEVLRDSGNGSPLVYSHAGDMFAVGVIMYMLLSGYHPFIIPDDLHATVNRNKYPRILFHSEVWASVSNRAKDLVIPLTEAERSKLHFYVLCQITQLCSPLSEQRPTATEALSHAWITNDYYVSGTDF